MGGNRAGKEQENADKRELYADQRKTLMDDQPQNDEADTCRIHHPDSMGATEQVRKPYEPEAAGDQRHNAGGDAQARENVDDLFHHCPSSPDGRSGFARPPLSPRPPVSNSFNTANVPMKLIMA